MDAAARGEDLDTLLRRYLPALAAYLRLNIKLPAVEADDRVNLVDVAHREMRNLGRSQTAAKESFMRCRGLFPCFLAFWACFVMPVAADDPANSQSAQRAPAAPVKEIPLYPGAAPGSEKWDWAEKTTQDKLGRPVVSDVVRPVLLYYPAETGKAVGTAMIVAPGGGFRSLMMSYEGEDVARRLNAMGVDAFILKYRLVHTGADAAAAQEVRKLAADDGRQAVKLVRERANKFGYKSGRVGMIGYSAGGMVTHEALFGPAETRPDFVALIYGAGAAREMPSPAPPLFLAVAADDATFLTRTLDLFTAYQKGKGAAELHVFQIGGHGFVKKGGGADNYLDRLQEWLATNKLLSKAADVGAEPKDAAERKTKADDGR